MARFICWRLAQFPLVLAVIYLLTFLLVWVAPGSPFERTDRKLPPEAIERIKRELHADNWRHFLGHYSWELLHGRFGPSLNYEEWSVNDILASALPISITLGLVALWIAVAVGVSVGTLAAVWRG